LAAAFVLALALALVLAFGVAAPRLAAAAVAAHPDKMPARISIRTGTVT
jgi:hypothetical protein